MKGRERIIGGAIALVALGVAAGVSVSRYLESREALRAFRTEADNIADMLELQPGAIVADVWAGDGRWSVDLARRLGPEGHVYVIAAEDDPIQEIYQNIGEAELDNLTVLQGEADRPMGWLEGNCCDALLVRLVYHHLREREQTTRQLFDEIRPGGRVVLIDTVLHSPQGRDGHGIDQDTVIDEMTRAGFELARQISDWSEWTYCLVFQKPESAGSAPPAGSTTH